MISFIRGELCEMGVGYVVVEASGVGYYINVPASVIGELPPVGTELKLYTHYSVKEDSQSLYGFLYKEDREMFRGLISVNGVGPKGALAILSVLKPDDLRLAIITGDVKSISMAQGIGKRTAERVILDLKDKLGEIGAGGTDASFMAGGTAMAGGAAVPGTAASSPVSEAIDALSALGYTRMEAGRAVGQVAYSEDMTTEDVLKAALKQLSR